MEFRIWVETRLDDRILERELVSRVERPASGIGPEEIGLTLEEGKAVLRRVRARIVQTQVDMLGAAHRGCCQCGRNQRVKDLRTRTFRTVFGNVQVSCRRISSLQLPRRNQGDRLASPPTTAVGNLAGTSIPLRQLGQQSVVSPGCSGAG